MHVLLSIWSAINEKPIKWLKTRVRKLKMLLNFSRLKGDCILKIIRCDHTWNKILNHDLNLWSPILRLHTSIYPKWSWHADVITLAGLSKNRSHLRTERCCNNLSKNLLRWFSVISVEWILDKRCNSNWQKIAWVYFHFGELVWPREDLGEKCHKRENCLTLIWIK